MVFEAGGSRGLAAWKVEVLSFFLASLTAIMSQGSASNLFEFPDAALAGVVQRSDSGSSESSTSSKSEAVLLQQPQATEAVEKGCFSRISDDTLGNFLAWCWN